MEINERIYKWILGWANFTPDSMYGQGYRDAMRDVLEEIEEFNENISEDNSTQRSK